MKMWRALGPVWLLLALLVSGPDADARERTAQSPEDRFDCGLMRGLQCRAESRAELLALYGLPTAESRLAAGSAMYRVFIFDGWMNHHVAITVERSPGSPPTLTLQAPPGLDPQGSGRQVIAPLSVPLSVENWYAVRRLGSFFERTMVPQPIEPGTIRICSGHGPIYFVESTDPEAHEERRLRRSGLGACQEGLADSFAIEVALMAADLIPACAVLDEESFTFTPDHLRACATLSGDTLAAAEVYNLMRPLLADEHERPSADQLESLLGGAEIGGSGAGEGVRPEQAWLGAFAGEARTEFVVERVYARDAGHVIVDGILRRRHRLETPEDPPRYRVEEAPVQIVWVRAWRADFEIEGLTIRAYAPAPDRCNSSDRSRRAVDC
jgi:hypothetical protein